MVINGDLLIGDTGKNLKQVANNLGYTDYINQLALTDCSLNGNFNYFRKMNNGIVIFNISAIISKKITANTYFEGIEIPTAVRPRGNVVFSAFSHNTSAAKVQYLRYTDGHLVIGFPVEIPSGNEINIWGAYYLN